MKKMRMLSAAVVTIAALTWLFIAQNLSAAPRFPGPPLPELHLYLERFDEAYQLPADQIDSSVFVPSWSGYALSRQPGAALTPWAVPMLGPDNSWQVPPRAGAVRFWFMPSFSSASLGGSGPGNPATLLTLVTTNGGASLTWWSLVISADGNSVDLECPACNSNSPCFTAPANFQFGGWSLLTVGWTPTNSAMWWNDQMIASGTGIPAMSAQVAALSSLVVGSDPCGQSPATGLMDLLTTFSSDTRSRKAPPTPFGLDPAWNLTAYGNSLAATTVLGPVSDAALATRQGRMQMSASTLSDSTDNSMLPIFGTNNFPQPGQWSRPNSTNGLQQVFSWPRLGTFWTLQCTNCPPYPFNPCTNCNIFVLDATNNIFVVDDAGYAYPTPTPADDPIVTQTQTNSFPDGTLYLAITGVSNGVANVILHGTTNGESYTLQSTESLSGSNVTWLVEQDVIGATNQDWTPVQVPTFGRPKLFFRAHTGPDNGPRVLFLQITGVSGGSANLQVYSTAAGQAYDIQTKQNLGDAEWASQGTFTGLTNWTSTSVPAGNGPSLFMRARCWYDTSGSGTPDWWWNLYFTNSMDPYALCPSGDGWTLGQAWANGWNPWDWHTPPAPSGLAVRYYGASSNVIVQWNPSPGPATNYVLRRYTAQTNSFSVGGQTTHADTLPAAPDPWWPPAYQVMAQYPGGPSAWSAPVLLFNPANSLQLFSHNDTDIFDYGYQSSVNPSLNMSAGVVRGPQGHLYLVTGNIPPGVTAVRVSVTFDQASTPSYPVGLEGNYLWEVPQPFTNAPAFGYSDVNAAALQSGFCELPSSLTPPYGYYSIKLEAVANDGTLSDCVPIAGFPRDAWSFLGSFEVANGAVPFLDGRRQIKENAEFQLRTAQGAYIDAGDTNQVPFAVSQANTNISGWENTYSESAGVDYVVAGFHFYVAPPGPPDTDVDGSGLVLDEFRPFEQNYFYANFLPSAAPWSQFSFSQHTGVPYQPGQWGYNSYYIVDQPWSQFQVHAFAESGSTNAIPDLLPPSAAQWLFMGDALYSFADLSEPATNFDLAVYPDYPNLYGLKLRSAKALDTDHPTQPLLVLNPGDSVWGYSDFYWPCFLEVDRPEFKTEGYYFARAPRTFHLAQEGANLATVLDQLDPRPGEPEFITSAQTPLLIAPIGQPLLLNAWAKEAITNGLPGKFAYLEQYFENALTTDASGTPTTNSAGLLSPYGEFFPMVPGPVAVVTMPDIDPPYQRGTGVVNVIKLQLDVNHDGTMDLSFGGPDNTSQARPFVFWINNDCDAQGAPAIGPDADLPSPPNAPDFEWGGFRSQRDLEDYARLWICGVPTLPNSGYQVTLNWTNVTSGSPSIELFRSVETNGGSGYLTDTNIAAAQINVADYSGVALGMVTNGAAFTVPASFFTNSGNKHFLFEGAGTGSGELVLTITQNGTNVLVQTRAWLDLRDVKNMFEHVHITGITNTAPGVTPLTTSFTNLNWVTPTSDEDTNIIVFVHGWRMGVWDYNTFSETMFKRLYWQGYRGRFVSIRWDTLSKDDFQPIPLGRDYFTYNRSEFRAWESGSGMSAYLTSLKQRFPNYNLNVCSHSMGGIVMAEALRLQLAAGQQNVNNYVLMQAAVPASCYDGSFTNYGPFNTAEQSQPTPNTYWGYPGAIAGAISGRLVNFFNTNDYALATGSLPWPIGAVNWEANQTKYKPDAGNDYWTDGTVCLWKFSTSITDPREVMSFCARARSKAVGAQPGVGGAVQGGSIDLQANFGFFRGSDEHSAQFNWNIQRVGGFYKQLGISLGVLQPSTP